MLFDGRGREVALEPDLPDAHTELREYGLLRAARLEQLPTLERLAHGRKAAPIFRAIGGHVENREFRPHEQCDRECVRERTLVGGREIAGVYDRPNERRYRVDLGSR